MKSMLYVGATLMIGASIYGFVDYRNSSGKKEFGAMYSEEKKAELVKNETISEKAETKSADTRTSKIRVVKKAAVKATMVKKEEVIPEEIIIAQDEKKDLIMAELVEAITGKAVPAEINTTDVPAEDVKATEPEKETVITRTVKKKRKLKSQLFSRGPLRDEVYEAPVKETIKKSGKKESKEENKEK